MVFGFALLVSQVVSAESEEDRISTRSTGKDTYEITLESTTVFDVSTAIQRIVPTARDLCSDRNIEPGRYTFDANQSVTGSGSGDWFRLVQNIRCVDMVSQPVPSSRAPQLENDAAEDAVRQRVSELSEEHFARLYANMGDDANAALAAIGGGDSAASSAVFETTADTPVSINLYRLTVYDNLPSAPAGGVYVAVDYDNRVGNVAHHCGYLMWHSFDAAVFTLGRIESGTLANDLLETMSEHDVYAARKQIRCANFYDE